MPNYWFDQMHWFGQIRHLSKFYQQYSKWKKLGIWQKPPFIEILPNEIKLQTYRFDQIHWFGQKYYLTKIAQIVRLPLDITPRLAVDIGVWFESLWYSEELVQAQEKVTVELLICYRIGLTCRWSRLHKLLTSRISKNSL